MNFKSLTILAVGMLLIGCGIADPKVVDYGDSADQETTLTNQSVKTVFQTEIIPVVRSYCVSCHNSTHRLPFADMPDESMFAKLIAKTDCNPSTFKNFLRLRHPGGPILERLPTGIEERFMRDEC